MIGWSVVTFVLVLLVAVPTVGPLMARRRGSSRPAVGPRADLARVAALEHDAGLDPVHADAATRRACGRCLPSLDEARADLETLVAGFDAALVRDDLDEASRVYPQVREAADRYWFAARRRDDEVSGRAERVARLRQGPARTWAHGGVLDGPVTRRPPGALSP